MTPDIPNTPDLPNESLRQLARNVYTFVRDNGFSQSHFLPRIFSLANIHLAPGEVTHKIPHSELNAVLTLLAREMTPFSAEQRVIKKAAVARIEVNLAWPHLRTDQRDAVKEYEQAVANAVHPGDTPEQQELLPHIKEYAHTMQVDETTAVGVLDTAVSIGFRLGTFLCQPNTLDIIGGSTQRLAEELATIRRKAKESMLEN